MNGISQITGWNETPYFESDDGSKKTHTKVTLEYSGAINGSGEVQYLMSHQSEGSVVFVGFEVITGKINGKSGSFTIQHTGKFENGGASSEFTVVPNSGTSELKNIEGAGSVESSGEPGKGNYSLSINT